MAGDQVRIRPGCSIDAPGLWKRRLRCNFDTWPDFTIGRTKIIAEPAYKQGCIGDIRERLFKLGYSDIPVCPTLG